MHESVEEQASLVPLAQGTGGAAGEASAYWTATWLLMDELRREQADALGGLGLAPSECGWRAISSGPGWRLREYAGCKPGPPLLIVAAPIKQSYIWDLCPASSAVRLCRQSGFRVYLLEWLPASGSRSAAGLEDYAARFLGEAVGAVARAAGTKPFLMGHSLGGTLAAIFAALMPGHLRGLVVLASPLSFAPQSSRFRDTLVGLVACIPRPGDVVAGALVSQLASMADPETFVWWRLWDALLCAGDPAAAQLHARVERWALDEVALPGRLVREILDWLYREDRFCRATLSFGRTSIGPAAVRTPTLAVVNTADRVAPPAAVRPFLEAMPGSQASLIEHDSEIGVALAHLAIVIGRAAHARVWPEIFSWLDRHA